MLVTSWFSNMQYPLSVIVLIFCFLIRKRIVYGMTAKMAAFRSSRRRSYELPEPKKSKDTVNCGENIKHALWI
jgi:hypothetical protein